jgi:pectate lyase
MRSATAILILSGLLLLTAVFTTTPEAVAATSSGFRDRPLEGFGADTPGGSGGVTYDVTSLADSGPGSLRDALSQSNRLVTFSVGGTIELLTSIRISGSYVTIDGTTAPEPGITITAAHSGVTGALIDLKECHDIVVRNIRICDAPDTSLGDNLRIWDDAYNIVVDHCSVRRGGDGALDISDGATNITIQWCIIAETVKNSLIRTSVSNLSLHHNLYCGGDERNPQLDDCQNVDMVNNVVCDWASNYGTRIRNGSSVNIVKNYYLATPRSDEKDAIIIDAGNLGVYMEANIIPSSCPASSTVGSRYAAPAITEMGPTDAMVSVLQEAGAWPRDQEDQDYIMSTTGSPVESTSWGLIKSMFR